MDHIEDVDMEDNSSIIAHAGWDEDTGMNIAGPSSMPFQPFSSRECPFWEDYYWAEEEEETKDFFSLGGMISDKGHFGNLKQFDDVDKIFPTLPLEVAVIAPWEHVYCLPGYDLQILEGLDNAPTYWYYGTLH